MSADPSDIVSCQPAKMESPPQGIYYCYFFCLECFSWIFVEPVG